MLKLVFRDRWRLQIIGPLTCHVRLGQAQVSWLLGKGIYLLRNSTRISYICCARDKWLFYVAKYLAGNGLPTRGQ
jgi:hypothetical protein